MRQGEVEIVPGVVGPEIISLDDDTRYVHLTYGTAVEPPKALEVDYEFRFDPESNRYGCSRLTIHSNPIQPMHGPITTASLRDITIQDAQVHTLLINRDPDNPVIRDLPNPDGHEPWGRTPPDDLEKTATDRALRWVAHLYRFALAVGLPPTKAVSDTLGLTRPTAGRRIAMARDHGLLGPAEVGKAG